MNAIDKVLDRLQGVKKTGDRRYIAKCSAHEDKSPSLSVRETDDGRVLIHCFGGCGAVDVCESLGLTLADLFDKPIEHHLAPVRGGFNARELLELTSHEALIAAELADTATTRQLSPEEARRLIQAAARLLKARTFANGH